MTSRRKHEGLMTDVEPEPTSDSVGDLAELEEGTTSEIEEVRLGESDSIEGDASAEEVMPLSDTALLGSILFASSRPLSVTALSKLSGFSEEKVNGILTELREYYHDQVQGFSLHEVAGGIQFRTAPGAKEALRKLFPPRSRRLSRAALETLSVIAYKQPVQRAEVESIRGVDALPTIRTLLEAHLIRIVGYQNAPGQPALYGTTTRFLEQFGLKDLADLPSLRELEQIESDPGEEDPIEGDDLSEFTEEDLKDVSPS